MTEFRRGFGPVHVTCRVWSWKGVCAVGRVVKRGLALFVVFLRYLCLFPHVSRCALRIGRSCVLSTPRQIGNFPGFYRFISIFGDFIVAFFEFFVGFSALMPLAAFFAFSRFFSLSARAGSWSRSDCLLFLLAAARFALLASFFYFCVRPFSFLFLPFCCFSLGWFYPPCGFPFPFWVFFILWCFRVACLWVFLFSKTTRALTEKSLWRYLIHKDILSHPSSFRTFSISHETYKAFAYWRSWSW